MGIEKTDVLRTIEYSANLQADGKVFFALLSNTIASGGAQELMLVTSTSPVHFRACVSTDGLAQIRLIEGITTSANGATVSAYNMNRNSSSTCTTALFSGPTWSTNSEIILESEYVGVNNNRTNVGGEGNECGWILSSSKKYLVQVNNKAGATITANIALSFYEE